MDRHLRPRKDAVEDRLLHQKCTRGCQRNTSDTGALAKLDLNLLLSSLEANSAAKKALYASNVYSFKSVDVLKHWIAKIPPSAQMSVRSIRLEIHWEGGHVRDPRSHHKGLQLWRKFLDEHFTVQLPNIRELHINISVDGRITCWREVQGSDLTQMFFPLRRLKDLRRRNLTVTLTELHPPNHCPLRDYHHDYREHSLNPKVTFWDRKELRRQWAEEIRELIPEFT